MNLVVFSVIGPKILPEHRKVGKSFVTHCKKNSPEHNFVSFLTRGWKWCDVKRVVVIGENIKGILTLQTLMYAKCEHIPIMCHESSPKSLKRDMIKFFAHAPLIIMRIEQEELG